MLFQHLVPLLWVFALSPYASIAQATLDAIFANSNDQPNRVCLGDGMGRFTCSDVSADTESSIGVALGDVNGDTFLDTVFANIPSNQVCLGDGTSRFTCDNVSADTDANTGVALGDVNDDTFLDAVFAIISLVTQPNQVCLGDGTGRFTCSDVSADIDSSQGVALGDMNGDTFLDTVFANIGTNRVCLGDGTARFTCSDVSADINESLDVTLGDVNGDTFLDTVFANIGANRICLGDGAGGFTCSDVSANTNNSSGVALGDVNGDTFLDAVFANSGFPTERNLVCLGDGTGRFTCSDVSVDANFSSGVALGEVDKSIMTTPVPISVPALSLWAWFLLSILLAGIGTIARHLKINMKDTHNLIREQN